MIVFIDSSPQEPPTAVRVWVGTRDHITPFSETRKLVTARISRG
jgi:hypothetical protein